MIEYRAGKALIARAFYQSFSDIERLSFADYVFFTQQALLVLNTR